MQAFGEKPNRPTEHEGRQIFHIPEPNFADLEAKIAKINKKAEKIGGQIVMYVFSFYEEKVNNEYIRIFECFIDGDVPKIDGWEFAATLDHSLETGNVIRSNPNFKCEIPEPYRDVAPKCEHCNINRRRNDTFLMYNADTNTFKQIGSSCLKDFFGHDPAKMIRMAELMTFVSDAIRYSSEYDRVSSYHYHYYDQAEYLSYVYESIMTRGWVSKAKAAENGGSSTSMMSYDEMDINHKTSDKKIDVIMGEKALEWVRSIDPTNSFENNILVVGKSDFISWKHLGMSAAIMFCYLKSINHFDNKPKTVSVSNFVGNIGDKITGKATVISSTGVETNYGPCVRNTLEMNGNTIVWFTGNSLSEHKGKMIDVSFKVKGHSEYKGVKNTIVSHLKVSRA